MDLRFGGVLVSHDPAGKGQPGPLLLLLQQANIYIEAKLIYKLIECRNGKVFQGTRTRVAWRIRPMKTRKKC